MSFAVPKGLPGNPNSRSIGRLAVETRVHNYWNHLIESASSKTGSLLIWDTGTYEILPRKKKRNGKKRAIPSPQTTDDESESDPEPTKLIGNEKNNNEKLISAFQTRYIRLRLHGTKLPQNYTIILRLPDNEITKRPTARRKTWRIHTAPATTSTDSEDEPNIQQETPTQEQDLDTDADEDTETRRHNAYPGSTNDIGSVHQRHWFMMLDRQSSGFVFDHSGGGKGKWVRGASGDGFESFLVRGREHERSVVTGRLARDVESDEGVEGFVGRGGWVGIED
jgi:ketosteroid isomerase-like protein